ncbi:unnamed protein product [Schistocephalus solidus]|uniref:Dynein_attach_N domain-containing protein n=1 Tax=Schistocephalus solidus TaxID=70667 RepID=A0A183T285_SCHSO|nr:unnamed protein product [Schistocephalus solidus]
MALYDKNNSNEGESQLRSLGLDIGRLEADLKQAVRYEERHWNENDAKIRAVEQRVPTYEDFRGLVDGCELRPLKQKEAEELSKRPSGWAPSINYALPPVTLSTGMNSISPRWPPLTGTQLSPVAHRSWALPSGYMPGNPGRVSGAMYASTPDMSSSRTSNLPLSKRPTAGASVIPRPRLADRKIPGRKTQTNIINPHPNPLRHTLQAAPVDIAALSETRFSEQGQLEEVGSGYTFFWSGRKKAERRDAGVTFAIRNEIVGQTTSQYTLLVTLTTATTTAAATTISDGDSLLICPHYDRTFTSHIGLVGNLGIHRAENGEPGSGAPTHSINRRLHCPHRPRAFTHRMGLFGHIRLH